MKEILILGATGGIGEATVFEMATEGHRLWLHYHKNETKRKAISEKLTLMGIPFQWFSADLSKFSEVKTLFDALYKQIEGLDVLINVTGTSQHELFQWLSPEAWEKLRAVNLDAMIFSTQAAVSRMFGREGAAIVLMSSVWGQTGGAMEVHYSCLKAATIGLVKSLAKELGPSGIRVNAVAPGWIETTMNQSLTEADKNAFVEEIPLERLGQAVDVAKSIKFLCSKDSAYITGQVIAMNGGYYI